MFRVCDREKAIMFACDPGSPIKIQYSAKVLPDGKIQLKESGKINLQDFINSFRDTCDINVIIRRLKNGDMSAMEAFKASPFYGDTTQFPKTYSEFLQVYINAQNEFVNLPIDVKQKFNNDVNQFIAEIGKMEWFDKLGVVPEKVEEVKSDE
jgi:hypothetical protein